MTMMVIDAFCLSPSSFGKLAPRSGSNEHRDMHSYAAAQAASQDVRNLSRFASDAAAITAQALPSNQRSVMASASSLDSQLPDNEELQV